MIDALVVYIESKGFKVRVMPRVLFIYTMDDGEMVGWQWSISRQDLVRSVHRDVLFGAADHVLYQLTEAIKLHKKEAA